MDVYKLGKFENPTFIIIFATIASLCSMDILTTKYVISNSIGYESNELLSNALNNVFYLFKYFATILVVLGIALLCDIKHKNLELVSYITLISFYGIVVLNNLLVIFANTDLNLNLSKLFLIFASLFVFYSFVVTLSDKHKDNNKY